MFDLIREQLQCTHRKLLLWWINNIIITHCMMRDDNLGMAFCAQGSTLEEGFFVPYAFVVDELTGFDIVDCVYDQVEVLPELVVEDCFRVWAHF